MGLFKRSKLNGEEAVPGSTSPEGLSDSDHKEREQHHNETATTTATSPRFKVNKAGEGDAALALFSTPAEVQEPIDPLEEKKVVRKIDLMILPVRAQSAIVLQRRSTDGLAPI